MSRPTFRSVVTSVAADPAVVIVEGVVSIVEAYPRAVPVRAPIYGRVGCDEFSLILAKHKDIYSLRFDIHNLNRCFITFQMPDRSSVYQESPQGGGGRVARRIMAILGDGEFT